MKFYYLLFIMIYLINLGLLHVGEEFLIFISLTLLFCMCSFVFGVLTKDYFFTKIEYIYFLFLNLIWLNLLLLDKIDKLVSLLSLRTNFLNFTELFVMAVLFYDEFFLHECGKFLFLLKTFVNNFLFSFTNFKNFFLFSKNFIYLSNFNFKLKCILLKK
jgi:hypothetical protein